MGSESSSSSSESGSREDFRRPGLYFSPIEVDLACTAGSPLGAKLASAFETCLGGEENNETSTADLMSLKPEVLAELDESAMATCAQERVAMIGKMMEKKHKRCANKFSEEDKAELTEIALKIQGYNCFKEMFHSACQKSVKSQVYAFFQAQAMAAASTEASTTGAPVVMTT